MRKSDLTKKMITSILYCDFETGDLIWKYRPPDRRWSAIYAGTRAGALRKNYIRVRLFGLRLPAHHIVWFLVHGTWPEQLDHRDGDRSHNAIGNLREATTADNAQNRKRRRTNRSGFTGVWRQKGRWRAEVAVAGERIYLGMFATKEKARAAYLAKKYVAHGFQPIPRGEA